MLLCIFLAAEGRAKDQPDPLNPRPDPYTLHYPLQDSNLRPARLEGG